MTEQQAQSPIDDLFRKTFENLPDSPAESGWDTPSDRVWQQVQANIAQPRKGFSVQSIFLLAGLALTLIAVSFWLFSRQTSSPATPPSVAPVEQPVLTPSTPTENLGNQTITTTKPSTGTIKSPTPTEKPAPRNSTEEQSAKPGSNAAQPLPGSKTTLPPNSTEAQKKQPSGNN